MIFTTSPETLSQTHPLFSNESQSRVSSGAKEEAFVMSSTEQAAVLGNSANIDMRAINVLP